MGKNLDYYYIPKDTMLNAIVEIIRSFLPGVTVSFPSIFGGESESTGIMGSIMIEGEIDSSIADDILNVLEDEIASLSPDGFFYDEGQQSDGYYFSFNFRYVIPENYHSLLGDAIAQGLNRAGFRDVRVELYEYVDSTEPKYSVEGVCESESDPDVAEIDMTVKERVNRVIERDLKAPRSFKVVNYNLGYKVDEPEIDDITIYGMIKVKMIL